MTSSPATEDPIIPPPPEQRRALVVMKDVSKVFSSGTVALTGTIADQGHGMGTVKVAYPTNGIQNGGSGAAGEPDGLALVDICSADEIAPRMAQALSTLLAE